MLLGLIPSARGGSRSTALRRLALTTALLLGAAGAVAQEEYRTLRTGGLSAEAAALLVSGQQGGSIPLFAVALPGVAEPDAKAPVEVFVEAQGAALLAGHEAPRLRIELCLYALAGSRVADSVLETVELELAEDRERLLAGGVKLRSVLELEAGRYQLRLLVRNVQTGELGLRSYPLEVPAADSGPLALPLLVPDPAGQWLRLTRAAAPPPAVGYWPAARPLLAADRDVDLAILVRRLEPDSARLEIAGADGHAIEVPAAVTPTDEVAPPGFDHWLVRARVPALEPGDYELRLRIADAAASPRLPVVLGVAAERTWAAAPEASADSPPATAAGAPASPGVRDRYGGRKADAELLRALTADYRGALARLAAADLPGALSELERLEGAAFALEDGPAAVAAAELDIARALARSAAHSLPPLFDLHYQAYRRYLRYHRFALSSHAREQLFDLIDLYLSQRPEDKAPAANTLAVMASQLQQSGLASFSARVFRRALAVDPAHEGALLGLAASQERHGQYREACDTLEQLLAALPGHREGRLRLAVNLARTGHPSRSRRLLTELVAEGDDDWVLAVAYHELARDLLRRQRLDEAESLLVAARDRLPDDDQLRLLLSAVADLRPGAAESDGALALRSRADRPSARHRYQQWPQPAPAVTEGAQGEQLQALAAALERLGSEA